MTALVLTALGKPLADTWGCTHAGHLTTLVERLGRVSSEIQNVERLGRVSSEIQNVAENADMSGAQRAQRAYREDLVRQLAELGANVLVMIAEELATIGKAGGSGPSDRETMA